ncbi:unnamed protein product, partial [Mesorhabditis belari]|uniref:Grh/CP2 DB domain-containing protein n=1 Tax=Mesorhabditis belari TaxID=2138241 RepID=A0AAF3ESY6_9BILA
MSFQLEQSSVIKTAPPGGRQQLEMKHEPIDLNPLSTSFQDLTKMQLTTDYYQANAIPRYSVYQGFGQTLDALHNNSLLAQQGSIANYYYPQQNVIQQDWSRNDYQQQYQRASTLQYASEQQVQDRAYKLPVTDMPSPVDSGIGADLSMIATTKDEFFSTNDSLALERPERALSHRDSPIIIPKLHNTLGFQYVLEAPISTSIRKDDDRMTYVNKGQFYTVTLDYLPDPLKPLKSQIVRSQLMVVFREDKTYEEEIKTWQFWHQRQHSAKQRILEVDGKNSSGMSSIGMNASPITEIAHNAVEFHWSPNESPVKISIAVQCLSTDFSNQKGVKGLPLHVQIDTYDRDDEKIPFHRGYCQIKVFCDKGANRKMLHETRRDEKRRLNQGQVPTNGLWAGAGTSPAGQQGSMVNRKKSDGEYHESCDRSEFYHMRELDKPAALFIAPEEYDRSFLDSTSVGGYDLDLEPTHRRPRPSERLMLYVRKQSDQIYTPLHIIPPNLIGLAAGVAAKFGIDAEKISAIYKRCAKGITVRMDDDMLRHYNNEETFVIDVEQAQEDPSLFSIFLIEIASTAGQPSYSQPQS